MVIRQKWITLLLSIWNSSMWSRQSLTCILLHTQVDSDQWSKTKTWSVQYSNSDDWDKGRHRVRWDNYLTCPFFSTPRTSIRLSFRRWITKKSCHDISIRRSHETLHFLTVALWKVLFYIVGIPSTLKILVICRDAKCFFLDTWVAYSCISCIMKKNLCHFPIQ